MLFVGHLYLMLLSQPQRAEFGLISKTNPNHNPNNPAATKRARTRIRKAPPHGSRGVFCWWRGEGTPERPKKTPLPTRFVAEAPCYIAILLVPLCRTKNISRRCRRKRIRMRIINLPEPNNESWFQNTPPFGGRGVF
jgi:hypothetical protein